MIVLAIDPGRAKCGIAVVDDNRRVLARCVVPRNEIGQIVPSLIARYHPTNIIIGRGTGGQQIAKDLKTDCGEHAPLLVDERFTSQDARKRYFEENPPRGLRRLIPRGLLLPAVSVDDYVAVILAERFLAGDGSTSA